MTETGTGGTGAGIACIGRGTIGKRIERAARNCGLPIRVFDPASTDPAPRGVKVASSLEEAVRGAGIVFEAISEDLSSKQGLYRAIDDVNMNCLILSTTSTFVPAELALSPGHETRLAVAHFFNPADVNPIVELVPSQSMSPEAIDLVASLLTTMGKTPITLRKPVPGFVANRLQAALIREALHLVEGGAATSEQVDVILRDCLAPRWAIAGLFPLLELGGLDIWSRVLDRLQAELCAEATHGEALRIAAAQGRSGAKDGRGISGLNRAEYDALQHRLDHAYDGYEEKAQER